MRSAVDDLLERSSGVATRAALVRAVSPAELDDEIRRGQLTRLFPRAYCRPWDADLIDVVERAAYLSIGAPAALSHLTALRRCGLVLDAAAVHLSIPIERMARRQPGLVVHRVSRPPRAVLQRGVPTARPANAIVTSWPLLELPERRATTIAAVRTRVVSSAQLSDELARHPRLAGRRDLARLIGLLGSGCESELEIWGLTDVFDIAGLRHGVRQRRLLVGGVNYRLDLAYDAERVCVELDGDAFHSTRRSRDRDRRRDAALASVGWLTLRFSYDRLHHDVEGCRRDTLATLATRRH